MVNLAGGGEGISHLVEGAVSILQYFGDTIFFMEYDIQKTLNMKLV
jgi:hypothetical protein